jgi:hypothetical protein
MANPFPFVAGTVLTAAQLNGIGEAWTSYTPIIKGGATTVTATLNYAKWAQVNKVVFVAVDATITSTGATNGAVEVSLPIAPTYSANSFVCGSFLIVDTGTAFYSGVAVISGAAVVKGLAYNSADNMGTSTPAMTLVNTDKVSIFVCYEVA